MPPFPDPTGQYLVLVITDGGSPPQAEEVHVINDIEDPAPAEYPPGSVLFKLHKSQDAALLKESDLATTILNSWSAQNKILMLAPDDLDD